MNKSRYLKFLLFSLLLFVLSTTIYANKRSVAIVIDRLTLENCSKSIDSYISSLNREGYGVYIIKDIWGVPDPIRDSLYSLYKYYNLEGAILIGDIPVAMIRDAQHLTTAFKMDQKRDWQRSSVPSDRFYDDFDLKFNYIKQDSLKSSYHYYSLDADSKHYISCDIYSSRIKPPYKNGSIDYEQISQYLNRVVDIKESKREIKDISFFAGHGYNSDCIVARMDERLTLSTQFSSIKSGNGTISYIDHKYDDFVRDRLMAELSRESLDIAILHHHGYDDTQYLNGSPITSSADRWLDMTRRFFRSKIRSSKDSAASKEYYIKNYDVPEHWVENAFNTEQMKIDSIYDASLNINIADFDLFKPKVPFIILDACFNGSYHLDDYIAAHYIFGKGESIVVKANSVNTLQDTWTNRLLGILDYGVSVGQWAQMSMTLESHLFGDPTYSYANQYNEYNIPQTLSNYTPDRKYWNRIFNRSTGELKSLAILKLYKMGELSIDELLDIQKSDRDPLIRMQAFYLISENYNNKLSQSIELALIDDYELLRRLAARAASANADPILQDIVYKLRLSPNTSKRVDFNIRFASESYPLQSSLELFDKYAGDTTLEWFKSRRGIKESLKRTYTVKESDYNKLLDSSSSARDKRFLITSLRNSNDVIFLDKLFEFYELSEDKELKILLLEAFGWYTLSYKRDLIVEFCKKHYNSESDTTIKRELRRAINRLST